MPVFKTHYFITTRVSGWIDVLKWANYRQSSAQIGPEGGLEWARWHSNVTFSETIVYLWRTIMPWQKMFSCIVSWVSFHRFGTSVLSAPVFQLAPSDAKHHSCRVACRVAMRVWKIVKSDLVLSCSSVCNNMASTGWILMKMVLVFFENVSRKSKVREKVWEE